jgi:hypothetical protein
MDVYYEPQMTADKHLSKKCFKIVDKSDVYYGQLIKQAFQGSSSFFINKTVFILQFHKNNKQPTWMKGIIKSINHHGDKLAAGVKIDWDGVLMKHQESTLFQLLGSNCVSVKEGALLDCDRSFPFWVLAVHNKEYLTQRRDDEYYSAQRTSDKFHSTSPYHSKDSE